MDLRLIVLATVCVLAQCEIIDLSCQEIKDFVDGHNSRRELLVKGQVDGQPAATNMKPLVWDVELAKKAEEWASHNIFDHNPDTTIGSGRFEVGENLYRVGSTSKSFKLDVNKALNAWFKEHKYYTYGNIELSDLIGSGPETGHYTQMSWADSKYIGCGISKFKQNKFNFYYTVCNYGPIGNMLHQRPYSTEGNKKHELICEEEYCSQKYGPTC